MALNGLIFSAVTDQWGNACSYIQSTYTGVSPSVVQSLGVLNCARQISELEVRNRMIYIQK